MDSARIFQLFEHSPGGLLFGLTATPGAALRGREPAVTEGALHPERLGVR